MDDFSLEKLIANDREEWNRLYERSKGIVFGVIDRLTSNLRREDFQDIHNAVLVELARKLATPQGRTIKLGGYIAWLAKNRALDRIRKQGREFRKAEESRNQLQTEESKSGRVSTNLDGSVYASRVQEFLSVCTPQTRTILLMWHFGDKQQSDIAQELGCQVSSVGGKITTAHREARAFLLRSPEGTELWNLIECDSLP